MKALAPALRSSSILAAHGLLDASATSPSKCATSSAYHNYLQDIIPLAVVLSRYGSFELQVGSDTDGNSPRSHFQAILPSSTYFGRITDPECEQESAELIQKLAQKQYRIY